MGSFGEEIRQLEDHFFVGRSMELEAFRNIVFNSTSTSNILNITGTGGIGKSSLLDQFRRICADEGIPFLHLDCVDFTKTPTGFTSRLLAILKAEALAESQEDELLQQVEQQMNHLAGQGRLILAIDTYEEMDELDDWLRNSFLVRLSNRIIILLAGRFPLRGGWVTSPAWRRLIKFMPLSPFDYETCKAYSSIYGECDESFVRRSYMVTKGLPLALSLYMGVINREQEPESMLWKETFKEIAGRWLRELPDPSLCELLEAATMLRVFNHEILESMLDREIHNDEFDKLTHLSFVRKTERGWYLHQVLRKALYQDFRLRKPQVYHRLWQRSVIYHYDLVSSSHGSTEERNLLLLDYIYVVGDPGFRAMFFDDAIDQTYYLESINQDNLHEAEQYVRDVLANLKDFVQEMFDPVTNEKYIYKIPKTVNEKWFTSIQLSEVITLGNDAIRLLKNEKHEAVGMFIYIPVHRQSLRLLEQNPITQSYFRTLSRQEREKLNVSPQSPAGWFQYKIDFSKDGSAAARFMFFQSYLTYFLKGGLMIYTTPMQYLQEAVKGIGYIEVPKARHRAFGSDFPAPVLVLDFREDKDMKKFVDNLFRSTKVDNKDEALDAVLAGLTPREREIALLATTCSSNEEIAQKLYLSEITVKKNLSRIYEKLEVKGKMELVKKLMSSSLS